MDKEYLKIVSTIHTGYNLYNGMLDEYDYTFFVLSTVLFRKLRCVKLSGAEHLFYPSKIENKEDYNFYIDKYEKLINHLDMVDEVLDEPGVPLYNVTELTRYILNLDDKVFNKYSVKIVEECLSIYFSKHHLTIQDSLQPQELNQLINYFLPENKNISVYNPFAGMCSLGMNLSDETNYLAEEINFEVAKLAELRFLISDKKNFEIKNIDSIKSLNEPFNNKYDFIVSTPPFGLKAKDALEQFVMEGNEYKISLHSFIIDASLSKLKENGKLVLTIPESVLYSRAKGNKEFRRNLVINSQIETLIKLPTRLFKSTGIGSYIIIFGKERIIDSHIRMIDASGMVLESNSKQNILDLERFFETLNNSFGNNNCVFVSKEEIIKNDYNLSINRYQNLDLNLNETQQKNLVALKDLVTIVPEQKNTENEGKFIKIGDLSNSVVDYTKTFEDIEKRPLRREANQLEFDTLLISLAYADLKPTLFSKTQDKIYYPTNNVIAFLIKDRIDSDYLVIQLNQDYVKKQVESKRIGTVIQRISKKDLLNLKIVVPSMTEQLKEVYRFKESIINKEKENFNQLVKTYGIDVADENSFLRHQIAGTLKNARGAFKAIKQIIYQQVEPELPKVLDFKRDILLETTLSDYLNVLERDILNITTAVNFAGKEFELKHINLKQLNITEFLTNYINEVENREDNIFEISINIDEELLSESKIKEVYILGDEKFLRRAFNNIIENAENHGFRNLSKNTNKIEIDFLYDFDDLELQIDFGNSGFPLPENYSHEEFIRKGSKKGGNSGEGIGGWYINEIMRLHNGRFGFTDETGPEGVGGDIVTTMELTFPFEIKL